MMSNQKGTDLGIAGLARQHHFEGFIGLCSAETCAGVLTTANFAQQFLEPLSCVSVGFGHPAHTDTKT